jgi:NAD(P)-dependent dehydrogenase (short-subunit alcohol dehydrogenase family)
MTAARTALVTGANRGLGLETSRQLARSGYRVLMTSRDPAEGGRAAASILPSDAVEPHVLDVADDASVARLADALSRAGERLDLLVANAGIAMKGFDAEIARKTIDVNFFGGLRVTEALLPIVRDGGHVVMVSSGLGELDGLEPPLRERFENPHLTLDELVALSRAFVEDVQRGRHTKAGWPSSAYRVSKIALNALVRVLARDLAPRHIRVNAVCPGWVRTDLGGQHADRSVEVGAASIVATALDEHANGGFFRDGKRIAW